MADYSYETLNVELDDGILTITLNRPERLNAVNEVMHGELEDVFGRAGRDGDVRAVVVTGVGRGFCSGGDVQAMDERGGAIALQQKKVGAVSYSGRRIIHNMLWVEQPVICALNGVAAGLGSTIALFCDVIYASDQARIGDTHVKAGLVAGDGGAGPPAGAAFPAFGGNGVVIGALAGGAHPRGALRCRAPLRRRASI